MLLIEYLQSTLQNYRLNKMGHVPHSYQNNFPFVKIILRGSLSITKLSLGDYKFLTSLN